MNCSCGGRVVITSTERDGERAGCERCHAPVSIERLLRVIDEQAEALAQAKHQMSRMVFDERELGWDG